MGIPDYPWPEENSERSDNRVEDEITRLKALLGECSKGFQFYSDWDSYHAPIDTDERGTPYPDFSNTDVMIDHGAKARALREKIKEALK